MAVYRSTAGDRILEFKRATARRRELGGLLAASAITLWIVWSGYTANVAALREAERGLTDHYLVNLNRISNPDELLPSLQSISPESERRFVALKLQQYAAGLELGGAKLTHVGAAAAVRVTEDEVGKRQDLPGIQRRLENQRQRTRSASLLDRIREFFGSADKQISVPLLDPENRELQQLKARSIVRTPAEFRSLLLWNVIGYLAVFYALHLVWRFVKFPGDGWMLPAIHLLTGFGVAAMLSLRDPLRDTTIFAGFVRGILIGAGVMLACSQIDLRRLERLKSSALPFAGSIVLSILLFTLGSGPTGSDAKVNLFGFQPVEVIRILLLLYFASYFAQRWEFLRLLRERELPIPRLLQRLNPPPLRQTIPVIAAVICALGFFFLQKDLGPALVMSVVFLSLYAIARNRATLAVVGLVIIVGGFFAGFVLGVPSSVADRVRIWLNPWDNLATRGGDQIAQSFWAFAAGGSLGSGAGRGSPEVIPAGHTDLVLPVIGEEFGFAGILVMAGLFVFLAIRGWHAALRANSSYGFFLGIGLVSAIAVQLLLIAGGVLGVLPLSGVVTPFLSFGSSSMICAFAIFGILLNLSGTATANEPNEHFRKPAAVVAGLLLSFGTVLVVKAAVIQVWRDEKITAQGVLVKQGDQKRRYVYNPRFSELIGLIQRGTILDRNGLPLAVSNCEELTAHTDAFRNLGVNPAPGCTPLIKRYYPFGGTTFHLLGDSRSEVNWHASNTSFLERDRSTALRGFDDRATAIKVDNGDGTQNLTLSYDYSELVPLLPYRKSPDHPGLKRFLERDRSLSLTLDARLQTAVGRIFQATIENGRGAAVVIDADSGEVLASVSYPWPKGADSQRVTAASATDDELLNRVQFGLYPPGSTFKLVTAIAALRRESTAAQTLHFLCRRLPDGRVGNTISGWRRPVHDDIADRSPHGDLDMQHGIIHSCNSYFAQLAVHVGSDPILQTAGLFGISVAKPNTAAELRQMLPFAGYGQGEVVARPLDMARIAATIANNGRLTTPQWLPQHSEAVSGSAVVSPEAARFLAASMRRVVTEGTGRRAGGASVDIAAKTGTAELDGADSHSWFVGFAPFSATAVNRIAFAVVVENGGYGGGVAAEIAKKVVNEAVRLRIVH